MQFSQQEIDKKLESLPEEIQSALTSDAVAKDIEDIATKNELLFDQTGILFDITNYVLLGLIPSNQFVKTLAKEAEIDSSLAQKIAGELNEKIFNSIKARAQNAHEAVETTKPNNSMISPVEQAGGFSIDRVPGEPENDANEDGTNPLNKEEILAGVENPTPSIAGGSQEKGKEAFTEPLVDQLLQGSVVVKEEKIDRTTEEQTDKPIKTTNNQINPVQQTQTSGPDLYREQI